jgi:hypothetical protein
MNPPAHSINLKLFSTCRNLFANQFPTPPLVLEAQLGGIEQMPVPGDFGWLPFGLRGSTRL